MLLTVPEGSYEVLVSNDGITGIKQVTIGRNQEVSLDLGDIDVEKKVGNVLFVLNPGEAELFVDGAKVDTGAPVPLEYGIHQLICRAEGYETTASYIKVGDPSVSITLTLTKEADGEDEEEKSEESSSQSESQSTSQTHSQTTSVNNSENTSQQTSESNVGSQESSEKVSESSPTSSETVSNPIGSSSEVAGSDAKVYIDGPEGTEIYVDGSYVGIAPISFNKPSGSVVITIRKTGYQTRSYTVQLENNEEDVHYSFSELSEIGQ